MEKFVDIIDSLSKKKQTLEKSVIVHSLDKKNKSEAVMLERVSPKLKGEEFLRLYRLDGTVWGRINKYVKKIVGPGFTFIPDPNVDETLRDVAKREAKAIELWSKQVGLVQRMRIIVKDCFLYGRGFLELCKNALGNDIVYIHTIDPLYMDYQRDPFKRTPLLDEFGRPIGYVFKEGYPNEVKLDREEVGHFKFFELSELDLGQSPLEPLYNVIVSKANFEKAAGEVLFRKGFPLWVLYVGDRENPPTPEAMEYAEEEFKNLDRVTELIFPYYYKLEKVEASRMEELKDYHEMFVNVIYEGFLSKPKRGPRQRQVEVTDLEEEEIVKTFQQELADQLVDQVISRVCKIRGYKTIPQPVFYEIKPATLLTQTRMIATLYRYGALTHDVETENWIRQMLRMPIKRMELSEDESKTDTVTKTT